MPTKKRSSFVQWANGTKEVDLRYDPWGNERYSENTTPTGYRYTSQRRDETLGLNDYNARYYDPTVGRFISADSIIPASYIPQTFNRYSYVYNNSLKYVDPTGHYDARPIVYETGTSNDFLALGNSWLQLMGAAMLAGLTSAGIRYAYENASEMFDRYEEEYGPIVEQARRDTIGRNTIPQVVKSQPPMRQMPGPPPRRGGPNNGGPWETVVRGIIEKYGRPAAILVVTTITVARVINLFRNIDKRNGGGQAPIPTPSSGLQQSAPDPSNNPPRQVDPPLPSSGSGGGSGPGDVLLM